ncbi:phosphomevalonate kinase [Malassezia equina]|uniref:phosphomevalonate kinase n=1 Tax=Malassezia equina TaxID=1381935 RepID=A0AAF0IYY1_9BASI|nr:phosphomevalonate kinase [Malassezia equina]
MVTTVSAPGKVLLAGGYLVLDPAYTGLVLATDARFYTTVATLSDASALRIRVRSPQFQRATWEYDLLLPSDDANKAPEAVAEEMRLVQHGEPNPFVALSLLYAVQLALEKLGVARAREALAGGMDIVIVGDNDFYSHRTDGQAPTMAALQALEPFHAHNGSLSDVHKTGLGSSAAMTTSLVAALLVHLGVVDVSLSHTLPLASLGLIHNLAQLAHCAAQGKVGSGFDVSASVWGNQVYRRFDPALLQTLMRVEQGHRIVAPTTPPTAPRAPRALWPVLNPSNPLWTPVAPAGATPTAVEGLIASMSSDTVPRPAPLQLPPGVHMCLADVDAGSNTRTMVGQVSQWRAQHLDWARQLYSVLAAANQSLVDGLLQLHIMHAMDPRAYADILSRLAALPSTQWESLQPTTPLPVLEAFMAVRNAMRSVRAGMRELGTRSGAPVEPPEMARLLDTTLSGAPGLLGGGVPGAGGYDALFLLFLSPASLTSSAPVSAPADVCALWQQYTELSVGPLLCGADDPACVPTNEKLSSADEAMRHVAHALAQARGGLQLTAPESVPGLAPWVSLRS